MKLISLSTFVIIFSLTGCNLEKDKNDIAASSDCFHTAVVSNGMLVAKKCDGPSINWRKYRENNIAIYIPGNLFKFQSNNDVIFETNFTNDSDKPEDYSIKLVSLFDSKNKNITCTPSTIGSTEATKIDDPNSLKGKVDFFEKYSAGDMPPDFADLCRPPVSGAAYAFCSEKENKTVLICISQITDNPQLAEDIFKTFRWTE